MGMGYGFGHPRDEKAERAEKLASRRGPHKESAEPEKRKGGRPKGSKNKAKR